MNNISGFLCILNHACVKQGEQFQFSAAGQTEEGEALLACVYSALCAHTWPSNGVNGY